MVQAEAPDDLYYWGGRMVSHYGHFILESLARLWMLPRLSTRRLKVLVWGEDPKLCLGLPFVGDILRQVGLSDADIVSFDRPTRIREIIVPATSLEGNHYVHEVYGRFCRSIAEGLTQDRPDRTATPVYIAKARLTSGTAHTVNEDRFAERLNRAGIDIFYPEQQSIAAQIRLWQQRGTVTGFLGSAMLTGAFAGRKSMVLLNHEPQVYSNQMLIDRLNDSVTRYVYPYGDMVDLGPDANFQFNFQFLDPDRTAEQFLRIIDQVTNGPVRPGRRSTAERSVGSHAYIDGPLGANLSRGRPATQSSILLPHSRRATCEGDASAAVSGILMDHYAFHTDLEADPWWSVDLGMLCDIHEVRLFNRLDMGAEHSRNFRILVSNDGEHWLEGHRRESEQPFGLNGKPYRWLCASPVSARHVKVQLIGTTYMHLSQVEVFGEAAVSLEHEPFSTAQQECQFP